MSRVVTDRQQMADAIPDVLKVLSPHGQVEVCGSYVRGVENPNDVDILLLTDDVSLDVIEAVKSLDVYRPKKVNRFLTGFIYKGILFEVFVASHVVEGSARLFLEGPADRNRRLRHTARTKGLIWKFDGLFDKDKQLLECRVRDALLSFLTS